MRNAIDGSCVRLNACEACGFDFYCGRTVKEQGFRVLNNLEQSMGDGCE